MNYDPLVATSMVQAEASSGNRLSIAAKHARPFEPTGLGPLYTSFITTLRKIANKRQSDILSILEHERMSWSTDPSIGSLAYQFVLSVLADYVAFGYYPVVSNGRCFLVPILESNQISPEKRRVLAQRLFRLARDRALADRDHLRWIEAAAAALDQEGYNPARTIEAITSSPPELQLIEAHSSTTTLDGRGLWRAVRTTWSMGVESSAPGREVAFVAVDQRYPRVPLGIVQFRNVVPEILARDRWLGVTAGFDGAGQPVGYLRFLEGAGAAGRLQGTRTVLLALLTNINSDGLPSPITPRSDPRELSALATSQRARFNDIRRRGQDGARAALLVVKRAETAADLLRGVNAIDTALASASPLREFASNPELLRDLNAGLKKIWHYHMGFAAIEMSICGAAPPFGPLRLGKLMASIAGSQEVIDAWGNDRPLGELAAETYLPTVRRAVPNPGPLVVFTSGLYPGHSPQYNRLQVGGTKWRKIGETIGYGSFQVSVETGRLAAVFNAAVDGYRHITRSFGEGASPRFREVRQAMSRVGLPDLLHHEIARPLYTLPLVNDPQAALHGWNHGGPALGHSLPGLTRSWWKRWVAPRKDVLCREAFQRADLKAELEQILRSATLDATSLDAPLDQ